MRRGDGKLTHEFLHDKAPQDSCGVFGVWAPGEDVAKLTYFGLYALQHRGQEAAGIAVSNGNNILVFKDMGLVAQVFDENHCMRFRANDENFWTRVKYWKTPSTTCLDGRLEVDCVPYSEWINAWTALETN